MTDEYAKTLRKKYLADTALIRSFLASPENLELLRMYESVVDEFQLGIIANRKDYQNFDKVMEYLVNLLFGRDVVLRQHNLAQILLRRSAFHGDWKYTIQPRTLSSDTVIS